MRHKGVRTRRHAFPAAVAGAVAATGAVAGLGYLVAFSAVAGWVATGIGAAVALRLWRSS